MPQTKPLLWMNFLIMVNMITFTMTMKMFFIMNNTKMKLIKMKLYNNMMKW